MECNLIRCLLTLVLTGVLSLPLAAQMTLPRGQALTLSDGLVISRVTGRGRVPLKADPVAAALLQQPDRVFSEGEEIRAGDQSRTWKKVSAEENGQFQGRDFTGGYVQFVVQSDEPQIVLLEGNGHSAVFVNDQPRTGDPYNLWQQLPVQIREGQNRLLFQVGRGRFSGRLLPVEEPVFLAHGDPTLPTILKGEDQPVWGAMPLINATDQPLTDLEIHASIGETPPCITTPGPVLPVSLRKVGFRIQPPSQLDSNEVAVTVKLTRSGQSEPLDVREIKLAVAEPQDKHQRTFVSRIDGSVQYYAVTPARPEPAGAQDSPGLVLSLHGAGVEARGQAACYQHKSDLHVVAPTNRRPFGFDWEDWGRIDALEVLQDAGQHLQIDPRRVYLSGHSMGGHGTWQLGAHFPDRFAAIGPSAGWISFWTYAGGARQSQPAPPVEILQRAANPSDTLLMKENYARLGIYVLHGDRDNNVPVGQARQMRKVLAEFHPDFSYYEQPGAGHWWGNPCVDWPPMMDFFRRHTLPAADELAEIDFTTVCPGISATYGWATVIDQLTPLQPSRIRLSRNRESGVISGTTENVRWLKLDLPTRDAQASSGGTVEIELDDDRISAADGEIWLLREADQWRVADPPSAASKGPHRYGLFKSVFDQQFVLVYSTAGTDEENSWSLAKARYDAETFWYRGNGSVDVVSDEQFDLQEYANRNVVLYGNADTNRAWSLLLAKCPLQLQRSGASLGDRQIEDSRLAALFVYPRPDSDQHLVGVVGGSGLEGLRSTNAMRYFVSGIAFPDLLLVSADYLQRGLDAVVAAGFWDSSWQTDNADIAWEMPKLQE
jgi:pimeloyl-ACP methyl ester carboxylesterase